MLSVVFCLAVGICWQKSLRYYPLCLKTTCNNLGTKSRYLNRLQTLKLRLPFASLVGASRNDPLSSFQRAEQLAKDWGSDVVDLGAVGHLNPASGYGEWPQADTLIARLLAAH